MKVILNKDLATLGEIGDVKDVAKGYARNYLFPRGIALPYNERTVKLFEARKEEIDAHKAQKRLDASGLKERIEAVNLLLTMPAGANGKLYGAVTTQTIVDELLKQGFQIERKKIEIPGNTIKSVGKYRISVKLYESAAAEFPLVIEGQQLKTETKPSAPQRGRRRPFSPDAAVTDTHTAEVPVVATPPVEAPPVEAPPAPPVEAPATAASATAVPAAASLGEAAEDTSQTAE